MIGLEELGRRLRQARERSGLKQEDAASALGIDPTAIAKMERGTRRIGAIELMRLASLYREPVEHFFQNRLPSPEIRLSVKMRAGEALGSKTELMQSRLQRMISDDRWLEEQGYGDYRVTWERLPLELNDHTSAHEAGYSAADKFRECYNLGDSPIADLAVLADEIGVVVMRLPLGDHDAPDGCAAVDLETGAAYVLVNSDKPRARRRFTLAHEIGHLAMGHVVRGEIAIDESVGSFTREETQANAFSAGLLMPEQGVEGTLRRAKARLAGADEPLGWVVWLAAAFGVSEEAAAYRLVNLGLSAVVGGDVVAAVRDAKENPELLRACRIRLGLASVTSDSDRGVTDVGPSIRARVASALEDGAISVETAAGIMHVSTDEAYRWIAESGIRLADPSLPF